MTRYPAPRALPVAPVPAASDASDRSAPVQALRAQLDRGFLNLRFEAGLERDFRDYMFESGRGSRLALFLMALILVCLPPWYTVHLLEQPPAFTVYALPLQCTMILAAFVALLLVWFRPFFVYVDRLCVVVFLIMVVCSLAQRAIGARYGFDVPLEFVGVIITAFLVLARVRFWYALPWVVLATVAMVLNEWLLVAPPADGYYRVIAMLMLIGMVCVGGYSLEYVMRQTWLNRGLLDYVSRCDGLTGLLNRKALDTAIQQMLAHARRERCAFGIAMIDIDYFKAYNDAYGHGEGDAVICRVADMLRDAARRPQDFCGRYGGEEFALVWADGDYDELCALAESLRARIEQAHMRHAGSLASEWVTVSIGLYWVDPGDTSRLTDAPAATPEDDVARLLDAADALLYRAKSGGRNRVESACRYTRRKADAFKLCVPPPIIERAVRP